MLPSVEALSATCHCHPAAAPVPMMLDSLMFTALESAAVCCFEAGVFHAHFSTLLILTVLSWCHSSLILSAHSQRCVSRSFNMLAKPDCSLVLVRLAWQAVLSCRGRSCLTLKRTKPGTLSMLRHRGEAAMVRYHVRLGSPGCVALVLEALSLYSPFMVENRTAHPLLFRPIAVEGPEPPFQKLPPYSAAGLAAIATSDVQKVLNPFILAPSSLYGQTTIIGYGPSDEKSYISRNFQMSK